jgi:AcrR family transcriptional regulator
MIDTKERILDMAERLFAENGYSGTSLRSIIGAAGVNLAAVHYHFRSKDALLDAVIERRVDPINRERLAILEELEREAGGGPLALEHVVMALVGPPMRLAHDPDSAAFVKLMGRILAESDAAVIRKHYGEIFERFMAAIARALPQVPTDELLLRAHFATGAMAHTLCGRAAIFGIKTEVTAERLAAFLCGGLRAPVSAGAGSAR